MKFLHLTNTKEHIIMNTYRNISIFALLFLVVFMLFSQTVLAENNPPKFRDPSVAMAFATYIPGAGHIYAGEILKGSSLFLASAGVTAAGFILSAQAIKNEKSGMAPGLGSAAISFAMYFYSLYDAEKAAQRTNAKNGLCLQIMPNVSKNSGGMQYGVTLGVSLPSIFGF